MQISSPLVYAAEKWANSGIKWPWRKNDAEPSLRVIEGAHRIASHRRQPFLCLHGATWNFAITAATSNCQMSKVD